MKIKEALGIVAADWATQRPVTPRIPAFLDLAPETQAEIQALLAPLQERGVPMELDPVLPDTVGILLEGRLFRVSVSTDRHTFAERVVILGPDMRPWDKETFLALVPDEVPEPAPVPLTMTSYPIKRADAEILEEVLIELRAIRGLLAR